MKRSYLVAIAAVAAVAAVIIYLRRGGDDKPAKTPKVSEAPKAKRLSSRSRADRRSDRQMSVLMDDDPVGNLRLEGRVIDDAEDGVGGAVVTIDSVPPRHVKTEADGSFAFDKLVARRYRVYARSGVGVAGPITARLTESNDPVILRLYRGAKVEVTVVDAKEKKPVSGAMIELRSVEVLTATSDNQGKALIKGVISGGYSVVASAPGFAPEHTWTRVAKAKAGNSVTKVRLELRRGARVAGIMVDEKGKPVTGARVLYSGASSWAQAADPRHDAAITGADGKWAFDALPRGSFRFVARHKRLEPGTSEIVELDGINEKAGIRIVLEQGATVRGRVVTKNKEPAGSARVRIMAKSEGFSWERPRQAYADEKGEFVIEGLPKRELELVALHELGSSQIVEVDASAGGEHQVEIVLDITDTISGIVVDSNEEPVEGAQVWAWPDWQAARAKGKTPSMNRADWQLRGRNTELTDAGGRFTLRGIKPGDYQVRASRAAVAMRVGWFREPVKAKAGDKDVKIVLEADGGVKGKVAFVDGKVPKAFTVSMGGWGAGTPFASKDGSFSLDEMPPRKYRLTIRGAFDTKVVSVDLKAGETKDLGTIKVRQGRIIAGKVVMSGKPVADATVRAGRILFGDGTSATARAGGPPQGRMARSATTDEDGVFIIYGVGLGDLSIVAEHETLGRSKAIAVRQRRDSIRDLTIALEPPGSLQGTVLKDGKPQANIIVNAQSQSVPGAMFGVQSGPDGKFRFDRLAPDSYKVSAMIGMPMTGMGFHSQVAVVKSGETTTVNLGVNAGAVTLKVTIATNDGKDAPFTQVFAVRGGLIPPKTARELDLAIAKLPESFHNWSFSFGTAPATVKDLIPAAYVVCAVPYPREIRGMGDTMEYMMREGDNLPVFCKSTNVAASPPEQALTIPIEVPKYVPPPKGDER